MKIALAADHRGYHTKEAIKEYLQSRGIEFVDCGTSSAASCDYPDFVARAARAVSSGQVERAIVFCGSGIGVCIVANKFPGVMAGLCHDTTSAALSRQHNDTNTLCLGVDNLSLPQMQAMIATWLETPFAGGRHQRRVAKIRALEKELYRSLHQRAHDSDPGLD